MNTHHQNVINFKKQLIKKKKGGGEVLTVNYQKTLAISILNN